MEKAGFERHEERVSRLTEALDFFSQVLSIEQLTLYGYTFLQGILSLEDAALYMKASHGGYELCNHTGHDVATLVYEDSGRLDAIATLLGRALWHDFHLYFSHEFVEEWQMHLVIPIIIQDQLLGFIVAKGILPKDRNLVDVDFVENIKNIMNMAFYMAVTFEKGKALEAEINKRIFNLFFVNHSTKVLLSELNLDHLYQLCIDVVRELTSSSMTSFCLYDEIRDCVLVKSYNDIVTFNKVYLEFKMKTRMPRTNRTVYSMVEHRDELAELIENVEDIDELGAKYVILLVKEEIIGWVTVGEPVNGIPYDEAILSQIDSLASSIYISITNALFIREIQTQRETIEQQLKAMKHLNRTVKNINSCQSIDEISEITLSTLEISHGVRTAFVASRISDQSYKIVGSLGSAELMDEVFTSEDFHERCRSHFYFDYTAAAIAENLPKSIVDRIEGGSCCIVSPLQLNLLEKSGDGIAGYIVIVSTEHVLRQEDLFTVETISNLIAPIFRQMQICTELEQKMKPDDRLHFFEALETCIVDKEEYQLNFRVYYKKLENAPFESPDLDRYQPYVHYVFDGYLYVIARQDDWIDVKLFDGCLEDEKAQQVLDLFKGDAVV